MSKPFDEAEFAAFTAHVEKARALIVEVSGGKRNVQGSVACPVCAKNALRYKVNHNGHIHAACPTTGCVRWME